MTDETDESSTDDGTVDPTEILGGVQGTGSLFGGSWFPSTTFETDVDTEPSEEVVIATRMMMAGSAINDFVEYFEDEDIDLADLDHETVLSMSYEQRIVLYSFFGMSSSMEGITSLFDADDDDDNPFKISDGDDPVY